MLKYLVLKMVMNIEESLKDLPTTNLPVMIICGCTTLTSQCPVENDHKRQQICQIRYEKCWVVRPVFFKFVYFTHHSHVTRAESQSNCSISRMCGPPGFHLMFIFLQMEPKTYGPPGFYFLKTGWTTHFFSMSDLLHFMLIFERTLWHQSSPPAYHHHVICPLY